MRNLVAGIDSSTQSCTVEIRDANTGEFLGSGTAPHPPTRPPVSEQHPDQWWQALVAAFGIACRSAGVGSQEIMAISVGAQCHGLVLLDRQGQVLRAAKLWNDTTSAPQAEQLVAKYGRETWVNSIGLTPTAALTISKLAWIRDNEPELLPRIGSVLVPHDWLTYRLSGNRVTDRSDASGTGYYSAVDGRWLTEILEETISSEVAWEQVLPTVLGPEGVTGVVTAQAIEDLGVDDKTLVGVGGGDQHLGAVGLGLKPGDLGISLGTSGVVLGVSPTPIFDESGWVDGVADATGGFLPLVCTLNSTKVTDTFARLFGVTVQEFGDLALSADVNEDRPTLVAYLDGERSPALPNARGLLGHLNSAVTRQGFALSVFEGVVAGLVRGRDALQAMGVKTDGNVVVAGGGAKSPAYLQVLADMLGQPVSILNVTEATSRGACIQAASVLLGKTITTVRDDWEPTLVRVVEPRPYPREQIVARYLTLAGVRDADLDANSATSISD